MTNNPTLPLKRKTKPDTFVFEGPRGSITSAYCRCDHCTAIPQKPGRTDETTRKIFTIKRSDGKRYKACSLFCKPYIGITGVQAEKLARLRRWNAKKHRAETRKRRTVLRDANRYRDLCGIDKEHFVHKKLDDNVVVYKPIWYVALWLATCWKLQRHGSDLKKYEMARSILRRWIEKNNVPNRGHNFY